MKYLPQLISLEEYKYKRWISPPTGSSPIYIYESPVTQQDVFFKQSHIKFPAEFWSEIIASKYGQSLGLNILDYNIGLLSLPNTEPVLGCVSETMIKSDEQELYHGVDVLMDFIAEFVPARKPIQLFSYFERLSKFTPNFSLKFFIEMFIFDALIGNQDRHTENWALITSTKKTFIKFPARLKGGLFGIIRKHLFGEKKLTANVRIAPIYDCGSCLGREIHESAVLKFKNNPSGLEKYLSRGNSEVRWTADQTIDHFTFIQKIKELHPKWSREAFDKLSTNYNVEVIKDLITRVDLPLAALVPDTFLTANRKALIFDLITSRFDRLRSILK